MKKSYLTAFILAAGTAVWVLSGQVGTGSDQTADDQTGDSEEQVIPVSKPPVDLTLENEIQSVRVSPFLAQDYSRSISLRGQSEALRSVSVKSEVQGNIEELPFEKGAFVKAGDVIARVEINDKRARIEEAKALLAQRTIEYEAAKRLSKKGFKAETQLAANKAELEAARANLRRMEIDLAKTQIKAPFDGILNSRPVEIGTYLDTGDELGVIVDLSSILVSAEINEKLVSSLSVGDHAEVHLSSGQRAVGEVRFIAARANPDTRTFRIEVIVPNPDYSIADGVTAELSIQMAARKAHLVSPGILTIRDDGQVGVFTLKQDNTVEFVPADILESTTDGLWLSNLPDDAVLVTVGQEFVLDGQKVLPVDAKTLQPFEQSAAGLEQNADRSSSAQVNPAEQPS
ncbi:efflux RND transporter periplasmic adaptor subunit [Kiloniella sp. b19]|uniref:efflux RND transporter periplasmic adaptor subunit n=1 Tax=Kiloniella sp. GXU_MW_B19 TaxID=3141326 RepID=UPI0031D4809D